MTRRKITIKINELNKDKDNFRKCHICQNNSFCPLCLAWLVFNGFSFLIVFCNMYLFLGMIIFAFFYFRISEMIGTKNSLWFLGVPHLVSWIVVVFAVSKWAFYAARFTAGIGDAVFFSAGPPYIGEITSPKVRGTWAFLPIFTVYLGATVITALGKKQPSF